MRSLLLRSPFDIVLLKKLPGFIKFKVTGKNQNLFLKEAGGHRFQRVPPSEKRGRVHTSSVTVAVLDDESDVDFEIDKKEIGIRAYKASGKGGQHRNKTESAIEITHWPTMLKAKCDSERSQWDNKKIAMERLKEKIFEYKIKNNKDDRHKIRKEQVGTGLRGDKIRTVQEQNDKVVNHLNGKTMSVKMYYKGFISELY